MQPLRGWIEGGALTGGTPPGLPPGVLCIPSSGDGSGVVSPEGIEVVAGGSPGGGTPGLEVAGKINPGGVARKTPPQYLINICNPSGVGFRVGF